MHYGRVGADNKIWQDVVLGSSRTPITQECLAGQKQGFPRHFLNHQSGLGYHRFKLFDPRVYAGAGYFSKTYDYLGIPRLSGAGFGLIQVGSAFVAVRRNRHPRQAPLQQRPLEP